MPPLRKVAPSASGCERGVLVAKYTLFRRRPLKHQRVRLHGLMVTSRAVVGRRAKWTAITGLELSLSADASRVPAREHSCLESDMVGSQGGSCDPTTQNDARGTR